MLHNGVLAILGYDTSIYTNSHNFFLIYTILWNMIHLEMYQANANDANF